MQKKIGRSLNQVSGQKEEIVATRKGHKSQEGDYPEWKRKGRTVFVE